MPRRGLSARRALRGVRRRARARADRRAAVLQAKAFASAQAAPIRVCWDLDNTLVDSGRLIRAGAELHETVLIAEPLAGMLEFHRAVSDALPAADHFVLSVRTAAMRSDTMAWLRRHGLEVPDAALCFVPMPDVKPAVWSRLARGARLLVVDDLTWGHESDAPQPYSDLVRRATQIADWYVGAETIAEILADRARARPVAARVAAALTASRS